MSIDQTYGIHKKQGLMKMKADQLFTAEDLTGRSHIAFNTDEACDAFVSHFPKYCKVRKSYCSFFEDNNAVKRPIVHLHTEAFTNKTTGEVNETAEKRRAKIIEVLTKLGLFE